MWQVMFNYKKVECELGPNNSRLHHSQWGPEDIKREDSFWSSCILHSVSSLVCFKLAACYFLREMLNLERDRSMETLEAAETSWLEVKCGQLWILHGWGGRMRWEQVTSNKAGRLDAWKWRLRDSTCPEGWRSGKLLKSYPLRKHIGSREEGSVRKKRTLKCWWLTPKREENEKFLCWQDCQDSGGKTFCKILGRCWKQKMQKALYT